jgi:hypothetical protein
MANPVHSLIDRVRDVRLSTVLAGAILVFLALDSMSPTFTPSLVLNAAHRPVNPEALLTFLLASPGNVDGLPAAALLFYFGPEVEKKLGTWRFLLLFAAGALGGVGVEMLLPPGPLGGGPAGAIAVLVVHAYLWPLNRVRMFGLITLGPRELLLIMVGYRFLWRFGFGGMGGMSAPGIGVLGGAAAGALICAWLSHTSAASHYRRTLRTAMVGDASSWSSLDWDAIPREGLHALTIEELDRIRAKAEENGIRSLNEEERAFVHRLRLRETAQSEAV